MDVTTQERHSGAKQSGWLLQLGDLHGPAPGGSQSVAGAVECSISALAVRAQPPSPLVVGGVDPDL